MPSDWPSKLVESGIQFKQAQLTKLKLVPRGLILHKQLLASTQVAELGTVPPASFVETTPVCCMPVAWPGEMT